MWILVALIVMVSTVTSQYYIHVDNTHLMPGEQLTFTCKTQAPTDEQVLQIYKTHVNFTHDSGSGSVHTAEGQRYIGLISNNSEINPELEELTDRYAINTSDEDDWRTYIVTITDVQPADSGHFTCEKVNTNGEQPSFYYQKPTPIEVLVYGPPRAIEIIDGKGNISLAIPITELVITDPLVGHDYDSDDDSIGDDDDDGHMGVDNEDIVAYEVHHGDKVDLQCHFNVSNTFPDMSVAIEGDGEYLDITDEFRSVPNYKLSTYNGGLVEVTASVHMVPDNFDGLPITHDYHNKLFTCSMHVPEYPRQTLSCRLSVTFSPQDASCNIYTEHNNDKMDNVRVECILRANPQPDIIWYDAQQQEIDAQNNHKYTQDVQYNSDGLVTATLYVHNMNSSDYESSHRFQASNEYGDEYEGFHMDERTSGARTHQVPTTALLMLALAVTDLIWCYCH